MPEEEKKEDVKVDPSTTPEPDKSKVEPESDKEKNFAELRAQKERLEKENEELRKAVLDKEEKERSLNLEPEKKEPEKKETPDTLKLMFERDMKRAVSQWNQKNKVTPAEWAEIKDKVALKGDELDDEIYEKIDTAYHSLPTVRQRREKELIEQGRKQAMRDFKDDELDFGTGGDVDMGGKTEPRFTQQEKSFAKSMGLTPEEMKKINKDANPNDWTVLDPAYKNK